MIKEIGEFWAVFDDGLGNAATLGRRVQIGLTLGEAIRAAALANGGLVVDSAMPSADKEVNSQEPAAGSENTLGLID